MGYLFIENNEIIGRSPMSDASITSIEVSDEIYLDWKFGEEKYIYSNGNVILNPAWETIQQNKEKERIAKLSITKYDFYKLVCKPNGFDYKQVMALINSDDDIAAAWNFCERVYRGDELLNTYIKQYLPDVTDETLDEIFTRYGI